MHSDLQGLFENLIPTGYQKPELILSRIRLLNRRILRALDHFAYAGVDLSSAKLIFRDHPLLEKVNILTGLQELGLPPSACWFVPKPDDTLYRSTVFEILESHGFNVFRNFGEVGSFAFPEELLNNDPQNLIVVDDGGDLIINCAAQFASRDIGPTYIETTTKGVNNIKNNNPSLKFTDLSSTKIKDECSCSIAASCVIRFRQILHREKLYGEMIHVVGFGRIGSHLARQLRAIGAIVTVSDIARERRHEAADEGFLTFCSVEEALRAHPHRFLFAASGRQSVRERDINLMVRPTIVASVSSQDCIPLIETLPKQEATFRMGLGLEYKRNNSAYLFLLAGGHALNLFESEGVSEPEFDPFNSLIFTSIVQAALRMQNCGSLPKMPAINFSETHCLGASV